LRPALQRLVAGGPVRRPVRPAILASWRRAVSYGLRPEGAGPVYDPRPADGEPLAAAADPVLTALEQDLVDSDATVVLADAQGRIVARYGHDQVARSRLERLGVAPGFVWGEEQAGTNAVGTAVARGAAVLVAGDEHFADLLTGLCGGGALVTDPCTNRPVGVVAILRRTREAGDLLVTVAKQAARDVEQRLRDAATARQRVLHEIFVQAVGQATGPLALVAREALLTDASAARMLGPAGGAVLWSIVSEATRTEDRTSVVVPLDDGACVVARCEAVRDGTEVVAVLVHLPPDSPGTNASARRRGGPRSGRPRFGWESLSEKELVVADLAARGRTNREIADALVVSPHTVDSHLRHIYGKLGISSRIALTRQVLAHGDRIAATMNGVVGHDLAACSDAIALGGGA
jgi:DNA-binding CsgD family transcriptional regulator